MSDFETWPTPSNDNDSLPVAARQWFDRAATAERIAAGLNSRRDHAILSDYAEECYAEGWRALTAASSIEQVPTF